MSRLSLDLLGLLLGVGRLLLLLALLLLGLAQVAVDARDPLVRTVLVHDGLNGLRWVTRLRGSQHSARVSGGVCGCREARGSRELALV